MAVNGSARCRQAMLGTTLVACLLWASVPARGQLIPAGRSAAVLSFVDAASGKVEIVRHWPDSPVDVDVYPYVPYFWGGCPGPGAVMMLVTAPASSDIAQSSVFDSAIAAAIGDRLSAAVRRVARAPFDTSELQRLVSGVRAPGEPIFEAAKSLVPRIAGLTSYERDGYAVFAFILWQGWRCGVIIRAVPEGYGIPFVR